MATPEEQKSRLQASRMRMRPISTNFEEEWDRFSIKNRDTGNRQQPEYSDQMKNVEDLSDVGGLETKRRAALMANRLQESLGRRAPSQENGNKNDSQEPTRNQEDSTLREQFKQNRLQAMVAQAMAKQQAAKQAASQGPTSEQSDLLRKEVKKKAKAAFRRGMIAVLDLIAGAIDLSTTGITFIIDFFIYMFTLGWLNLEMFYGTYFSKKKSRFVSPISWDPIPMPVDKEAYILQSFIIAADLLLAVAVLVLGAGGLCILHDYVLITQNLLMITKMGADLAAGGSAGLCLGGILIPLLGF
ncbi:hypothetical protein HQ487_02215 [Candidatus Uhrbacteria bacterium]|nr:hypothetical protein [Candidatus Uhrbacteria bacterium]